MADPLTSFSLACGVAQMVSLSCDIFKLAKTIAERGSPDPTLTEKAQSLSVLSDDVNNALILRKQQSGQPPTSSQVELEKVTKQCLATARAIIDEFSKIKWKQVETSDATTHRIRGKFPQAFKMMFRKSKIEKLEKDMGRAEQALQFGLLSELWFSREDAKKASHAPQFQELNPELQRFIQNWSDGHTRLMDLITKTNDDIREEVRHEHSTTRHVVATHFETQESAQDARVQYEQLINSLYFGSMNQRRNNLRSAHEQTFKWFYDDTSGNHWSSFPDWLRSDEKVYWIFGKPGSGKSTLMKYLVEDSQSLESLKASGTETLILSFFLWSVGSLEQRNIHGLLCSLLHQIFTAGQKLTDSLLAHEPEIRHKRTFTDWSVKDLKKALFWAVEALNRPVYIFLDGLDEIDRSTGPFDLIELIKEFQDNCTVKLCISSRPEPALQKAFDRHPKLRLQDLTQRDMAVVADDFLGKLHQQNHLILADAYSKQSIVKLVVERSGGVFLWVYLVLKSIQRGVVNIDSDAEILERIQGLPRDLETLYSQTWQRHGEDEKIYRAEAVRYFKTVLQFQKLSDDEYSPLTIPRKQRLSLFRMAVACDRELQVALLEKSPILSLKDIIARVDRCRERIGVCCNGLLEIQPIKRELVSWLGYGGRQSPGDLWASFLMPLSTYLPGRTKSEIGEKRRGKNLTGEELSRLWMAVHYTKIEFLHRSAADFLLESEFGRRIMADSSDDENSIILNIVQATISEHGLYGSATMSEMVYFLQPLLKALPTEIALRHYSVWCEMAWEMFNRGPALEQLVENLKSQVLKGEFGGHILKIYIDFVKSTPSWCLPDFEALYNTNLVSPVHQFGPERNSTSSISLRHLEAVYQLYGLFKEDFNPVNLPAASPSAPNWPYLVPGEVYTQAQDTYAEQLIRSFIYTLQTTWLLAHGKKSIREWVTSYFRFQYSLDLSNNFKLKSDPFWRPQENGQRSTRNLHLLYKYYLAYRLSARSLAAYPQNHCSGCDPVETIEGLFWGNPTMLEVYVVQLHRHLALSGASEVKHLAPEYVTLIISQIECGLDLQRTVTIFIQLDRSGNLHGYLAVTYTPWYEVDIDTLRSNSGVVIQCSLGKVIQHFNMIFAGHGEFLPTLVRDHLESELQSIKVMLVCHHSGDQSTSGDKFAWAEPDAEQAAQILDFLDNKRRDVEGLGSMIEDIAKDSNKRAEDLEAYLSSHNLTVPQYYQLGRRRGKIPDRFDALFYEFEGDIVWRILFPDAPVGTTIEEDDEAFKKMLKDHFGELNIINY